MSRSRDSHGQRGPTASEHGISEESAEFLRRVANNLVKRNPGLMKRWLTGEATDEEFQQAFGAEVQRMEEAGEL